MIYDIFTASLLKLYCGFSSLTLTSIVMISFYIPSNFARVVSITENEYGFGVHLF